MNTSRMIANRFGIGGLIGQGSMGEVYRGLDTQSNELVAIKALKQTAVTNDPDIVERFVREGEALRRLNHPNIVKVLTSAIEGDRHYIVMEYVGGGALDKLLKRERPLPLTRALEIAIDLADALVRAHRVKIIHRDIKPQNVLLAEDGTPRLTDFGVAHMSDMSTITQSGALVGTMPYLSPEAWQFDEPDVGTDIWAFGVMLYEMLAGQRPFDADQPSKLKQAILHQPLPDLREFRSDVPPALAELIGRMLEKDHTQRIGSMRVIGAELEAITRRTEHWPIEALLGQAVGAPPTPIAPTAPPLSAIVARSADLDLTITSTTTGYSVRLRAVQGGPNGPPQDFASPFDLATLPRRRDVADWVKQARIRRLRANEELRQARDFGAALFQQLFTGAVLEGFHASRAALPHGDRLRLRLRVPPDLAVIPWELLFDPHAEQFLALAPDLTLLRATDALAPVAPLHLDGPLQVVVVLASPVGADYPPIQLDRELRRIETVLKGTHTRSQVALDVIRGPGTLDQLRTRLRTPLHVLHVLCHGDLDETRGGVLIFEDTDGAPEPVGADLLRALLQRRQPRLVLLNACLGALPGGEDPFSSVGAGLLAGGVPAVIAMQFELAEDAAVELARVFYAELAAGMPVDMALAEARLHLFGCYPTRLDWAIPVLFLRTDSGALFVVPPPSTREAVLPVPALLPPVEPSPRQMIVEQRTLQRLWHLALTAYVTRDWERAAELLEQVAGLKPDHEDVQTRLAEARRQLTLPPLYRQALALRDDDHWQTALEVLSELERQQPDYRDAEGVRAWAERRQRREQCYRTALEASVRRDWAAAIVALDTLLAELPDDVGASALLARAHAEQQATMAREQQRRAEAQQRPEPDRRRAEPGTRDPRARYGPPIDYIERGEFAAALNLLEEMLRQDVTSRVAAELASTLIERLDVPLDQRRRAAALAARVDDLRPGVGTLEPAWCAFPPGQYVIGAQRDPHNNAAFTPHRVGLDTFQIARYPITVRQFQRFWEDSMGYASRQWWTPQGWAWKQGHGISQPYRWGDYDWMALNQPVIGVSWYEAMAFCAWLTQRRYVMGLLRRGQLIRLPSEAEWEIAATWDRRVGQLRAWRPPEGASWQNTAETRIGHASPVGLFPEGASPCGALDMAGNVWEWCGSRHGDYPQAAGRLPGDFTPSEEGPALRGGAYNTAGRQAGWSARTWYFASQHQQSSVGFRVVLVSKGFW